MKNAYRQLLKVCMDFIDLGRCFTVGSAGWTVRNMIELGITEDMVYGDLATSKGDSYGRGGGNKTWKGRYQGGGGRRFAPRERNTCSSNSRACT